MLANQRAALQIFVFVRAIGRRHSRGWKHSWYDLIGRAKFLGVTELDIHSYEGQSCLKLLIEDKSANIAILYLWLIGGCGDM